MHPISAGPLGHVARGIRRAENLGRPHAASDRDDADAGSHGVRLAPRDEPVATDRLTDPVGDPLGLQPPAMLEQQAKLIAPETGQRIARAHPFPHQFAQLPQQVVAGEVTARIVHPLEPVQVEVAHGVLGPAAGGARQRVGESPLEFAAVHQTGKGVVRCLMGELACDQPGLRHVSRHHGGPGNRSRRIADGVVERSTDRASCPERDGTTASNVSSMASPRRHSATGEGRRSPVASLINGSTSSRLRPCAAARFHPVSSSAARLRNSTLPRGPS